MDSKQRKMITIPCGGRPKKEYSANFLATLQFQSLTMTQKEIAELHGVSRATIARWLKKARELDATEKEIK